MGLFNGAGAADAGGISPFLKLPGFGAIGNHMLAIITGKGAGEGFGLAIFLFQAGRNAMPRDEFNPCFRPDGLISRSISAA